MVLMPPDYPEVVEPASLVMLVLGVGLMLVGARLYGLAVISPGLAAGAAAGLYLPVEPQLALVIGVIVAGVGAAVCKMVEQAGVRAFGALLMAGATWSVLPLATADPPVWGPAAGAAVGLLLFPRAFKALVVPLTSLGGALLVAYAVGRPDQVLLIAAGAAAGTVVQLTLRRPKVEDDDEDES